MKNTVIIGCDPDSDKSGIAMYFFKNKRLQLQNLTLLQILERLKDLFYLYNIELHIENLNGISSNAFNVKGRDPLPVKLKKAEHVGKCKQVQIEIERIAKELNIKIVHHPVSKNWKDSTQGKKALKKEFGYEGRSNEDTRSAAWFCLQGIRLHK